MNDLMRLISMVILSHLRTKKVSILPVMLLLDLDIPRKQEEVLVGEMYPKKMRDIQTVKVHLGVVNARIVFVRTIPI
jgi:hypothetical protein